ncbi:efflux RND transporter periplasmic adaptor subunit [Aminobacter anthyllidis]|uniref:Efflux RND transporter periplasmic adaptor subunit n=1 Tax=Aminobacter anthyllidis TaxID=1035067 RepID=A0A9X1ADX6_9HYPH|nr:efflux RND transporter periplasmic adaptor subunit [Aminobacter anthyllidis]MBT1158022.1 efflux RND transporter periplasmic adaptor subunit [Aminobacter anthyllidis]
MTHYLHRRAGIAAAAVALLASAVMPAVADGANAAVQAETAKRLVSTFVVASDMTEWTLSFTGILAAREEVAVGAPFQEQRISSVEVEVGDRVTAGQILVRLDTAMRDNQLRESEGRLARANAALAQQQAKAAQALAALQRAAPLKQSGALSTQAFADRASTEAVERQGVALAQAEVDQAVAQLTESRRLVERNVIVAPVAGVVSERNANAGALTGADPLIRLIRDGEVELAAEIPERELPRLAVGQAASVSLPGVDGKIPGKVRLISPKIDRDTRLGVARIAFETDTALFPGAFARAVVVVANRQAIVIADSALVYGGKDKTAVFVVEDGKVDLRPVQTGMRNNGRLEIRAGLKEGDVVVAKAGASLRDGDVVATTDIGAKTGSVRP